MIEQAKEIALRDLRACYGAHGILAGRHHFDDYWARDSFFAIPGVLAVGDHDKVKSHLDLFMELVRIDGLVPLRIGKSASEIVFKYFGYRSNNILPRYHFHIGDKPCMDSNALFIIAFHAYITHTRNFGYARKHMDLLKLIVTWYDLHKENEFIQEPAFTTWTDSVKKQGAVFYTNVCYARALWCMYDLCKKLHEPFKSYKDAFDTICDSLQTQFWTGEYFADWKHKNKMYNYFSTDGNTLAIIWNIATKEQARHIEEASHIFDLHDVPSKCVHPPYPKQFISTIVKIVGIPDYHNGVSWLWLGCINAIAKHKIGLHKQAKQMIQSISQLIVEHNGVYEVYEKNGSPVNRFRYKAEQPFSWSAGMFLWACDELKLL